MNLKAAASPSSRNTTSASTTSSSRVSYSLLFPCLYPAKPVPLGYNEIDTARIYIDGAQEAFTREAHWSDRGLTLATKCWPTKPGDHAPEPLTASLEKSLSELGSKSVDIFYLHAPDRSVPFAETLETLNSLHKAGKFVQLGLSNFAAWEVAEICTLAQTKGWVKPSIYQAMYNAITRNIEPELVPCCRKFGLDIVVYNPLAGGIFSGKYQSKDHVPEEGRYSAKSAQQGKMYRERYFRDATFEALKLIEPVAEKHNLTLLEIALRWCVNHSVLKMKNGGRDGVIIGVSSFEQLVQNLANLEKGPLPEEVVKTLDQAWETTTKATCPSYWR